MGGGGVMRAAAKVAGINVVNAGLRGVPAVSPTENPVASAARNVSRSVSAIVSSSDEVNLNGVKASQNNPLDAAAQTPYWELDDWELAGGQEEMIVQSGERMPRLVFGRAPTVEEAKEATSELKDALNKVYLSSPKSTGSEDSHIAGHGSALSLFSKPEHSATKDSVTSEFTAKPVPKNALNAFKLLNESPAAQTVVASIASDPNVWHAVLENDALVEFLKSEKRNMDPVANDCISDADFLDHQSGKCVEDLADSGKFSDSENGFMGFLEGMKSAVVGMMSSLSDFFQNLFGEATSEKVQAGSDRSAGTTFVDKAVAASFMGLAIMVIMVVVLKRA